jgi:hypothetical protein
MLEELVGLLAAERVSYCVIGGQAVNAYVEPLVGMDLDLVVATPDLDRISERLRERFQVDVLPHSVNLSLTGSGLRVHLQRDPRYTPFLERASRRDVLGVELPVASLEDVLQGKVRAALDTDRPSKRQKDLADIARILEAYPALREHVPREVLQRLM